MNGLNNFEKGNIVPENKKELPAELAKRLAKEHQQAYDLMSTDQKRIFDARHGGSIFEKMKPKIPRGAPVAGPEDPEELVLDPNAPPNATGLDKWIQRKYLK